MPSPVFSLRQEAPWAHETPAATAFEPKARPAEAASPNVFVRVAFALTLFAIPFTSLYVPGTGDKVGVLRLVQLVLACAVISQPRICLRFVPVPLFWFLGYVVVRMIWGLWLTPELASSWWPDCRAFLQFLPWVWVMFNLLQFPGAGQRGLWALGAGCFLCALCHVAGIGEVMVPDDFENRSSAFGMHANEQGETYAAAMIALLSLWMTRPPTVSRQLLPFPMMAVIGVAMAKTGSRSAILILVLGVLVLFFYGESIGSRLKRLAGLIVFLAVLTTVLWQIPTVMTRFQEINPQNIGQNNPRARMAPVLWEMFLRSPVYGLGPDHYQAELTRRAMPYLIKEGKLITAHNQILLLLVETGLIGFTLFSTGLGLALAAAWRARAKSCGPLPLALLLPFVVSAATVSRPEYFLILWAAVAYALAGATKRSLG